LSEIEVFGQEKGSYMLYFQISDKIESKKGGQKFWDGKREISFLKKVIRKFPSPQSRRQVSANARITFGVIPAPKVKEPLNLTLKAKNQDGFLQRLFVNSPKRS